MKRWACLILTVAMALSILSVGVFAATSPDPNKVTLDNGVTLTLKDNKNWEVTSYTPKEDESSEETGVVVLPALYKEKPVMTISATAFAGSTKLLRITIPGTVKKIPDHAFENCTNLNTVTFQDYVVGNDIEGLTTIGQAAFKGCIVLSNLALSSSIKSIASEAFHGCASLKHVIIPKYVQTVGTGAFANCSYLEDVTFLSPFTQAGSAFVYSSLTTIHCLKGSVMDTYLNGRSIDHHIITCEDKVKTPASCTKEGSIEVSFTCTYKHEIKEPVKDEAGNPTGENKVTGVEYCPVYGEKVNSETRDTSVLPHRSVEIPATDAGDCKTPAKSPGTKCSVCGTIIDEPEILASGEHKYTVEKKEELIKALCEENGLNRITMVCSVCGKVPTCEACENLVNALDNAEATAQEKKEALDKALAEKITAEEKLAKAQEALDAATKVLTDAGAAKDEALAEFAGAAEVDKDSLTAVDAYKAAAEGIKAIYDSAQTAVQDKQTEIETLEKEIADLQKALETAEEADKPVIEEQIKTKQDALAAEKENLETLKAAVEPAKEKWDAVNTAYTKLLTTHASAKNAQNAVNTATAARDAASDALGKEADGTNPATGAIKAYNDAKAAYAASSTGIGDAKTALVNHTKNGPHREKDASADLAGGLIKGEDIPKLNHPSFGPDFVKSDENNKVPDCLTGSSIILEVWHTCEVCGEEFKTGEVKVIEPAGAHKRPDDVKPEIKTPATCTEEGVQVWPDCKCAICGADIKGSEEPIDPAGHLWGPAADEVIDEPDCTHEGHVRTGVLECQRENCSEIGTTGKPAVNRDESVIITTPALGHEWGDFVPDAGQDTTQPEDCHEKTVTGSAKCNRCGESSTKATITIPGKADHTWGEWTLDADGKTEHRTCKVCGKTEKRDAAPKPDDPCKDGHKWGEWVLSADGKTETRTCQVCGKTETRDATTKPDEPSPDTEYTITVVQGAGGTITVSRTSAKKGTSVTITVRPDSGYELDMVRVIGDTTAEDLTGSRRSFIMPASNVKVQASFTRISSGTGWGGVPNDGSGYNRSDPTRTQPNTPVQIVPNAIPQAGSGGQLFWDVPSEHWAAGEIAWANGMEYMSGSNGMFNPNEPISAQQMWMVLARINGTYPSDMVEARHWAVLHGFADASSPTSPVTRQQLMTALYRCAYLKGAVTRSNGSLAGYRDSRLVPAVARDAFVWGVSNGIITGDSSNCLRPSGVVSRAEFAVFLYRFDLRV